MEQKIKISALLVAAFAISGVNQTVANEASSFMEVASYTTQPIGHYEYCKQYTSDCRIKSRNTKPTKLTRERWRELVEINAFSNNTIEPVTDQEAYNVPEIWVYPKSYGDCEDYVLMKRHMLIQRGWPASSLLITVVRQPNGEGHAVLTARTDRGDFILDNLEEKIQLWDQTPYTYLKRQASNHSGRWIAIKDRRS